jgi:putative transposase
MKLKAFKFKIEPNQQQQVLINKTLGCSRFLYNQMLSEKQLKHKNSDKSKCKTEKEYKSEYEWLKEVDSIALQQSRLNLKSAYDNFFDMLKSGELQKEVAKRLAEAKTPKQKAKALDYGKPKFKSKHNPENSYRTVNGNNYTNIRIEENKIKLPKLGFVRFKKSREVSGKIKSVTISKNILGRYYISILCETEIQKLIETDSQIGIDLGLKEFCITSDNELTSNPKFLKESELKLIKAQRKLSLRKKNSNRRFKQQKRVFKLHEKIRNQRLDFLHKLSTKLINENQVICLEDLQVKNMVKNHKLSKSISDVSWSKFVELLKYKANWYGRDLIQIDKFFPSSKLCSNCGNIKKDLTLKDREYHCDSCGIAIDRDYNAALNILREGLRILKKNRRDGEVSSVNIQTLVCSS